MAAKDFFMSIAKALYSNPEVQEIDVGDYEHFANVLAKILGTQALTEQAIDPKTVTDKELLKAGIDLIRGHEIPIFDKDGEVITKGLSVTAGPLGVAEGVREAATQGSEKKEKVVTQEEYNQIFMKKLLEEQGPKITKDAQGNEQITVTASAMDQMIHRIYEVGMQNGANSVQLPPEMAQDPQQVYNHEFNQQLMAQNAPNPSPIQGMTPDGRRQIVQHPDLESQAAQRDLQMLQQQYPTRSVDELSKLLRGF